MENILAQQIFQASDNFVQTIGGELNKTKSFSFGHECLQNSIDAAISHHDSFRLLGGSITYRSPNQSKATAFGLTKLDKWTKTIKRCRHLPVTWSERCSALMRTRSQYTWGSGCHTLCTAKTHEDLIIKSRSSIMRCLLRRDQYIANPSMYFCLITPPSLNHLFDRVIDGLCTARRVLIFSSQADDLKARFQQDAVPNFDGPISFLKQVNEMSGFEHCVDKLIQYGLTEPEQWLHEIRSVWRKEQFKRIAANRPAFDGVQHGVDRDSTIHHLRQTERYEPLLREDLLQNAALLRLLLTGGLFTQSINSRHRKRGPTDCTSTVGGEQTVEHVSWYCSYHHDLRIPILHLFHLIIQASPAFRFASIITQRDAALQPHIQLIQSVLIRIWRAHIKKIP